MVTRQQLEGKWNEVSGRLKEKWGNLTDDDLSRGEGNVEQLVGIIQQKTGRAREEIEKFINSLVNGGSYERIASTARDYAQQATDAVRTGYDQATQQVSASYQQAEESIRRNPVESIAVSFGAGLITGVLVSLMLRDR